MSSQVVIDGFNLIYKFPDLEEYMVRNRLLEARQGLLERIESYSQKKKEQTFHVFFDGKKKSVTQSFRKLSEN
ncbi:YacP-like NYN domain protein [Leptospira borgpetersenii str. Noumea 25]|nr:YacP-like NYN domain protein [Leptospira borgpetersenii str. Noumea 25]